MPVKLGIVMDPITTIHYHKDTSLALLWAAQDLGWDLFYLEQGDLWFDGDKPMGAMRRLVVHRSEARWFSLTPDPAACPLNSLDVILMRKDPPFDINYIYSTYILEAAEALGTLVVNSPRSLRDCNEKLFTTHFPQCIPPLLVSSKLEPLLQFASLHGDIVLKPLDSMGGQGVFKVIRGDPNLRVIYETLSRQGKSPIMAQRYLPEITEGDKRILMINGNPVPYCLARLPQAGEFRGNLAAGGKGSVQPLSERDYWIASEVGPVLQEKGLMFVGLDVIGSYLTEMNVTSPTCLREIEAEQPLNIAASLMQYIASALAQQHGIAKCPT